MESGDFAIMALNAGIWILGAGSSAIVMAWRLGAQSKDNEGKVSRLKEEISGFKVELIALKAESAGTIALIETKHMAEVERNDIIVEGIKVTNKEIAEDQKKVVERITILETVGRGVLKDIDAIFPRIAAVEHQCIRTQTICEQCVGRPHCDEAGEKEK